MAHLDPHHRPDDDWADWPPRDDGEGWPPREDQDDSAGWRSRHAPQDGGAAGYGRHRARHSAAAPDPYEPYPQQGDYPAPGGYPTQRDYPHGDYQEGDYRQGEHPSWGGHPTRHEHPVREAHPAQDQYPRRDYYAPPGSYPPPSTGSGWDQPTAEHPSTPPFTGAEPFDVGTLPPTEEHAGRSGGRRRGKGQQPDHNGAAVTADAAKAPSSRAGRNLPAAIAVGVTLGAVVIASLFVWKPAFLAVITVAIGVAIWELTRAVRHSGAHPPLVPLLIGGVLMGGLAWYEGPDALSVGLLVTVLAAMVWRLADGPAGYQRDITAATLVAVYVPFLGGFAALLAEPDDGAKRVIVTLAAVVLTDTGGYAAGVLFGRHPMAPSVSPKKSWEGLVGSLVAAGIGGALLLSYLFDVELWWGAVFGLAIAVVSVLGDLAESMLKRDLGVKDMSNLLPGHGGLMDRLDSILFAMPAAYLLLSVLVR